MALDEYRKKRDFSRTPEPSGKERAAGASKGGDKARPAGKGQPAGKGAPPSGAGGLYVIQKHAARQLHYDLRLQLGGVLASWAVPKGPSLDPSQKRLAVHVEDHPVEYGSFEGTIPEGEYGGGTVELWDRGTWMPLEDPVVGMSKGTLKIMLAGEKLKGMWTLVRLKPRGDEPADKNWLLFKDKDEFARPASAGDILTERPESVASGWTIDQIKTDRDGAVFSSAGKKVVKGATVRSAPPAAGAQRDPSRAPGAAPDPGDVPGARKARMPSWLEPQLATLVAEAPSGEAWIHEVKFDGYRMSCYISAGKARLLSRNDKDWTQALPEIASACAALPVRQAILDGEVIALRADGASSFGDLKDALSSKVTAELKYQIFDLLYLDGHDLTGAALGDRKRLLATLTAGVADPLRYTDHLVGAGEAFHQQACRFGLEGVVSKRADRPHSAGRGRDWLKIKCLSRQEFVVAGYTDPAGPRTGFGALVLGYYDATGRLAYAGRVGTGFDDRALRELRATLEGIEQAESPFAEPLPRAAVKGVHWVRPALVAEVQYSEWTKDGSLRHPSFVGMRDDKQASDVAKETPRTAVAGITLTHPDKVLYAEQGLTKSALAAYYLAVADWMRAHLEGRPLTLVRCPDGRQGQCFYQKHLEAAYPQPVHRVTITDSSGPAEYAYVDSTPGVIGLVQMDILEIHTWGSRVADLERPDRIIFDLDPAEGMPFSRVIEGAVLVRDGLAALGLTSFVKTTGGKGLHVVAPIEPDLSWPQVTEFTKALAHSIEGAAPDRYTANPLKTHRTGRVFVDYVRNVRGATAVAAYSTRAREGATVSVPLEWTELEAGVDPKAFTVATVPGRLSGRATDRWRDYWTTRQRISPAARAALGV